MKYKTKKGQSGPFNLLYSVVTGLGLTAVFGVVYLLIMNGLSGTLTAGSTAQNITNNATVGIGNVFANFPLIGTIAGLVVVLAIVIGYLVSNKGR